jgi:O-methyltransferase
LAVYKGNFAKRINEVFPERQLILFDTFEKFNENDVLRIRV